MNIRRAGEADAAAIAHVHLSARAEAYGDTSPPRAVSPVAVAVHDGVVVGFAAVDGSELSALYVLPGAQGSGAGRLLLRWAVKEAGAESLWVYSSNAAARRFYERFGWVADPESETTGEDWHPRAPALRYRAPQLPVPANRAAELPEGASSGAGLPAVTVAVTDHAAERFLQRVGGSLDAKADITRRVASAWQAGRVEEGEKATVRVSDERRRDVVYVCRWDRPRGELLVVTLWEEGEHAAVPKRYTDALRRMDRRA